MRVVRTAAPHTPEVRSDAAMGIVQSYQFENTKVHIANDHFVPADQVEQVLNDMHKAGWEIVEKLIEAGEKV